MEKPRGYERLQILNLFKCEHLGSYFKEANKVTGILFIIFKLYTLCVKAESSGVLHRTEPPKGDTHLMYFTQCAR